MNQHDARMPKTRATSMKVSLRGDDIGSSSPLTMITRMHEAVVGVRGTL